MQHHILDNPIWEMLITELAPFSTGTPLARRSGPAIVPAAAVVDHTAAALADLAALFAPGEAITLFEVNPPRAVPGFGVGDVFVAHQLVSQGPVAVPEHAVGITELSVADGDDMVQLVALTQPGPFFPGLLPMRRFVGIRHDGQLVAMAGERIKVAGYTEISGVCTHPDWRGHGYATLLTCEIARGIRGRGETPFLHVDPDNTSAYRIYTALNFHKRAEVTGVTLTRM